MDLCSLFRVIPAEEYLDNFLSDRSHMVSTAIAVHVTGLTLASNVKLVQGQTDVYLAAPPLYPPLRGRKMAVALLPSNLMSSFVYMGSRPVLRTEHATAEGAPQPSAAADITDAQTYGEVMGMSDFLRWISVRP